MPLILQIETSTDVCSIALSQNGQVLSCVESTTPNSHSEKITQLISACMAEAVVSISELDAVAVSEGPGSYTSLRIGVSTAKGMCYALGIPLLSINSLSALACGVSATQLGPNEIILPMIDARRMEVYTSVYDYQKNKIADTFAEILSPSSFDDYLDKYAHIHLCGNGAEKYYLHYPSDRLVLHHITASASYLSELSMAAYENRKFENLAYYTPNYFKDPNITTSTKKLF